jgi:hypothetical protein
MPSTTSTAPSTASIDPFTVGGFREWERVPEDDHDRGHDQQWDRHPDLLSATAGERVRAGHHRGRVGEDERADRGTKRQRDHPCEQLGASSSPIAQP